MLPYLSARSGDHLLALSATTTRSDNSEGHEQGCLLVDQPCAPLTNDEPTQDSPLKKRKNHIQSASLVKPSFFFYWINSSLSLGLTQIG